MNAALVPIKFDIWSDVACPWCYLGKHRLDYALERYRQEPGVAPVEIEYHSYQLDPDLPANFEGSHSEYLASHLGMSQSQIAASNQNLAEVGAAVGAKYNMDRVVISNTRKANELLHFAKAHGKQQEMKERLFRAYWAEGRRLGRVDELVDLAAAIGLDEGAARQSLETGKYRGAVRADMEQGERYGIAGVPFFLLAEKYGLSGAQETDTFLRALATIAEERRGAA